MILLRLVIAGILLCIPTTSVEALAFSSPISHVPNWAALRTPEEWNRSFSEYTQDELIALPAYNLTNLTTPLTEILIRPSEENLQKLTAKLTYSTRFFGDYTLDSNEFEAVHPGIDIKAPRGTPVHSIGSGEVHFAGVDPQFGNMIITEHQLNNQTIYAIYAHLDELFVTQADPVDATSLIGIVGTSGNSTNPHLHFQFDWKIAEGPHTPYWPTSLPSRTVAQKYTINPFDLITVPTEHSIARVSDLLLEQQELSLR